MFIEHFKITSLAVFQIFFLGAIGYFLVKKNLLGQEGVNALSHLVIKVTLPALILYELLKNFDFALYPNWWIFPLISIAITALGLLVGMVFMRLVKGTQDKWQFLSLVTFQNSGYLPLALSAALLPKAEADTMFIYLFLFLLAFNLLVWSFGVYLLTFSKSQRFNWGNLFTPPVVVTIFGLSAVFFGINKFVPETIFKPLHLIGDCTLPLALLVVGGNLAQIKFRGINKQALSIMLLAKLIIIPLIGVIFLAKIKLPQLIGLLIIIELAVPSATSLSVITVNYNKEDLLISQGIFFSHILSLFTLPLFLSLYFMFAVLQ